MTATSTSTPDVGHKRSQISLLCDAGRRERYADQYETPVGILEVVDFARADKSTLAVAVIDTANAPTSDLWSQIDVPVLISPELLAAGFASSLPDTLDWAPLMPWPRGNDVAAAAELVAAGRLGSIWQGQLSTGIGEPSHPTWETDEWWVCSSVEALFGGLLVSEALTRAKVVSTRVLTRSSAAFSALHTLEDDRFLMQTAAPSAASGFPWLSVELLGDSGRIQVNDDFAPGNVAVWDSVDRQFVFPALPFAKPNVQAADSSKGGWDLIALLASMLSDSRESRTEIRVQARRLAEVVRDAQL